MIRPGLSRRSFLQASLATGGGLLISRMLTVAPGPGKAAAAAITAPGSFEPVPFVRIGPDGTIVLIVAKTELGQGVRTALPAILAEELEADWRTVRIEQADYDGSDRFGSQQTGGSNSVSSAWEQSRRAGALARELLIAAAAAAWDVDAGSCAARNAEVVHRPSGRRMAYAELARAAASPPIVERVDVDSLSLKPAGDYRLVGKPLARVDLRDVVTGAARFGIDTAVPGMRHAVVLRPPAFGAQLVGFDDSAARKVPGVLDVFEIPAQGGATLVKGGVAILAADTWSAMRGRDAVRAEWTEPDEPESTDALSRRMRRAAGSEATLVDAAGDVDAALRGAERAVAAEYELPFLAHAPMEPLNALADARADRCILCLGTQAPEWAAAAVAQALELEAGKVLIRKPALVGGGFGRRLNPDYAVEAALISRQAGVPVKLLWTREDDVRGGIYRAACRYRMRGGLDADGAPLAWHMHLVNTPVTWTYEPQSGEPQRDEVGGGHVYYRMPNHRFDYTPVRSPVTLGWWRAVSQTHNNFAIEAFVDEMAHAAGRDPLEFRRQLLKMREPFDYDSPWGPIHVDTRRLLNVLELAARRIDWYRRREPSTGVGIACCPYAATYAAQAAEVTVENGGEVRVTRMVCAFDCGRIVNPDIVRQQIEGSIAWGLSAALFGEITLADGAVEQGNFNDYRVLRLPEMPQVNVVLVDSAEPPSGAGEPAVPPVAPAVVNAIFAATGQRVRRLPVGELTI